MKTTCVTLSLFLFFLHVSHSLDCYSCSYSDYGHANNDKRCKNEDDSLPEDLLEECSITYDACVYIYSVNNANGKETYTRGCGRINNNNGEDDKCHTLVDDGIETTSCICNSDACNGVGKGATASVATLIMTVLVTATMTK